MIERETGGQDAAHVVREDDYIDNKHFDIEEQCIDLIATQQPMGKDLRILITILHISVELERTGDYPKGSLESTC